MLIMLARIRPNHFFDYFKKSLNCTLETRSSYNFPRRRRVPYNIQNFEIEIIAFYIQLPFCAVTAMTLR